MTYRKLAGLAVPGAEEPPRNGRLAAVLPDRPTEARRMTA
jgi:hypothetical protein